MNHVVFECEACESLMSIGPLRKSLKLSDVSAQLCTICGEGKMVPKGLVDEEDVERVHEEVQ